MIMRNYKIHFIRHAASEGSDEGRYIGHTDCALSEEGRAQLLQMKDDCFYPHPEVVFSSPLKRCTDTCSILFSELNPIIIDGLIECNFGEFENKTADELSKNEDFTSWLKGETAPPFGESSNAFGQRVCSSFEKIAEGMMKSGVFEAAIVTHGGVISAILEAYGIPEAQMHEWMMPNCCGYTALLDPAMWMRSKKFEVYAQIPEYKE